MNFFNFLIVCAGTQLTAMAEITDKTKGLDTTGTLKMGDIVINEIMADPDPAAGSFAYPEYIELYNKKQFPISLKNWKICVGTTCKTLPNIYIPADSFLVITSSTAAPTFPEKVNVIGITSLPALTNTGQILQLLNDVGNSISVISYTDAWYQDPLKKEGGYSLEQVDAANPCAGMDNWRASVDKNGGTPGKKNSVAAIHADKNPPEIQHINVISTTQLELVFTESMDSTTLFNPSSYQISNIGTPINLKPLKPTYNRVQLILGTSLQEETVYTISVDRQLRDCVGNTLEVNNNARFAIPSEAKPMDIVINEVLFDPNQNGVDFVEIFNRSNKIIDLKTILMCHYDSIHKIISAVERITNEGYLLFPGEYLVLTENANVVKQQYETTDHKAFLEVENLPTLNADKGDVALKTVNELIDFFAYDADMHFSLLHETKGISLERVSPKQPTNNQTNWHSAASSVGFATPGFKNSQFVDAIETAEIVTVLPEIFTPDNDGINDLVSLYYHLEKPEWSASVFICDQKGRLVKTLANNDLIGTEGFYTWDGTNTERAKEPIGIYVIYVQFFNLSGKIKAYKKVCVLSGKN